MKSLFIAAALTLTASSAFAALCEVDMVDNRTNRLITRIRAYDSFDSCKEGMKACRLEIRQRGLLNRADCIRVTNNRPTPTPDYNPNPNPNPYPDYNPNPYPSTDARRMLNNGETVIMNNVQVQVIGVNFNGLYAVRANDVWRTVTNNVRRENLAVMNGCALDVCTSESVIDIINLRSVRVIGLHVDERLVIQANDVWNTITSNVDRSRLAKTQGCISSRYAQICVGNQVIDRYNRYSTVAGIQLDGRVVLRANDVWNTLSANNDATSLVVVR